MLMTLMLLLVLVWVTSFLVVLVPAVVLLSDADGDKTSIIANFCVLVLGVVLVFAQGGSMELLLMSLIGLLLLLLMTLMVLVFGVLLGPVLVAVQGYGAATDAGNGADGSGCADHS